MFGRPRTAIRLGGLAAALLGLASPRAALAQACTGNSCAVTNRMSVHIGAVLRLRLDGATTVVASPTEEAYRAGYQDRQGPRATVIANTSWKLQVSAAQVTWSAEGREARLDKPAAELSWGTRPDGAFTSLSTSFVDVATGAGTRGTEIPLYYRTQWTQARDAPGTYSLEVPYTLVSN